MTYLQSEDFVAIIIWFWLGLVVAHELLSQVQKKPKKDKKNLDK
jgi:hypothetical protein